MNKETSDGTDFPEQVALKAIVARASLVALPHYDDEIQQDYTAQHITNVMFACARATFVAVSSAYHLSENFDQQCESALHFLNENNTGFDVQITQASLQAQIGVCSHREILRLISLFDEFLPFEADFLNDHLRRIVRGQIDYKWDDLDLGPEGMSPSSFFWNELIEVTESANIWSFWREWYQGFLERTPMDWELQRRVAMIPDMDWEKGPEHIAQVIEDIRARFALEQRLAELESEISTLTERNRHSIGGNNPPEEIEQEEIIQGFLVEPVQELQTQVLAEVPDKSRVRKAVEKLTALLVVVGKWTGGKLDKAVDECVKSIGKRAGDSLFAWVVLNSAAITGIVSLARTWLNLP
ncbi:hypothetical protein [Thalassobius sp. I31.1]|uniref:hypothetical protein n=1 Tax=Thalassobius sp. I31.1 TaxID=2109912 RepID=UPI000D1A9C1D|nr:hypothetical protein [Thalassobius sp. I31.1]